MSNYEHETREAYQSQERAAEYRRYHTSEWSWGRVATWFERRAMRRLLAERGWYGTVHLLDVPCGTGILATALVGAKGRIIASDIAGEMMALAAEAYRGLHLEGFVRADITAMPFATDSVDGAVVLGFMHRVPSEIRAGALAELRRVSRTGAIVSFSLDSPMQRMKHAMLSAARGRKHKPAPYRASKQEVDTQIGAAGFTIVSAVPVLPWLSTEWLYVLVPTRAMSRGVQ